MAAAAKETEKTKEAEDTSDEDPEPPARDALSGSDAGTPRALPTSRSVPLLAPLAEAVLDPGAEWGSEADLAPAGPRLATFRSPHKVQFDDTAERPAAVQRSSSCGRKSRWRSRTVSETSTVSCNSIASSATSSTAYSTTAPDGGYGWVVVAASFFVNMIADGVTFSFGVMFDEFQTEFGASKATTAGIISVFHSLPLLTGPVATWLTDRHGCRAVTVAGSLLAAAGFLAAAFSRNIYLLYLFFGVVAGFGLSLCYVAAIIIVAYYFDRRRSFATGISVCGSGVGTFLFAPLTQHLMDTYGGWRGACIVLAGVFLNMAVCGMLYRDLPARASRRRLGRTGSTRSLGERGDHSNMPEIEQLRTALQQGDVCYLIGEEAEEPMLASSLITIPTYIKNSSKVPKDVLTLLANNQQTFDFIQEHFPDSLILAKSVSDHRLEEGLKGKAAQEEKAESKGVKLKRRVSSMMRTKSILKTKTPEAELQAGSEELQAANPACCSQRLHHLRVRRQSLTYRGACLSTTRYHMRASSCPDIYRNSMGDLAAEQASCLAECSHSLAQCCALNYMTPAFAMFCLSNFILYFWYDVPYVYTIGYAEKNLNIPNTESTMILSVIGILNTVGEVGVGWLADLPGVSSNALYAVCMLVCGLVTALTPFIQSYPVVLLLSALYGLCISANYSLTSPILVDLVSLDQFSSAYGCLLFCQGLGNLVGPPVAGWLYDTTREWFLTFCLAGIFIALSGALLMLLGAVQGARRCCQAREGEGEGRGTTAAIV